MPTAMPMSRMTLDVESLAGTRCEASVDNPIAAATDDMGHIADFLAAALYVGEQPIFTDFTEWTTYVLQSRGVPPTALRIGLGLVRDQLVDFPTATSMLDAALAGLPSR